MAGEEAAEQEPNHYLITLRGCRDTLIPNASHAVYAGQGDPGSSIASAVDGGGWVCTEAAKWTTELLEHTKKVMPAFDDAASDVSGAISAEQAQFGGLDTVPKGHPHGIAWNRMWRMQRYNI